MAGITGLPGVARPPALAEPVRLLLGSLTLHSVPSLGIDDKPCDSSHQVVQFCTELEQSWIAWAVPGWRVPDDRIVALAGPRSSTI